MYSNIVAPLDGSAEAERVLPHAQDLAKAFGATLHLVQVVSRAEEADLNFSRELAEELIDAKVNRAEIYLTGVASRLEGQGITVATKVLEGSVSENIIDYARDNDGDLIVISTRGQGGIQRLLIGSTTDRVIRTGHIPVLAVPPED